MFSDENGNAFLVLEINTGTQGYLPSSMTLYAKREVVEGVEEEMTFDEQVALGLAEGEKEITEEEWVQEEEEEVEGERE